MYQLSSGELLKTIKNENTREAKSISEARQNMRAFHRKFRSDIKLNVESMSIGDIPVFKISGPLTSRDKVILFFHGGGFVVGCTEDHLELCGRLSYAASMPVISIDYRLSPEYAFPAALEDCMASFAWLTESGFSPSDIAVLGISAGGNLAISMCMNLRDTGSSLPAGMVCISPAVNLTSSHSPAGDVNDWLNPEVLELARRVYIKGKDEKNPLISPLCGNLEGLPPVFIQAGSHELLFADIVAFKELAEKSGIKTVFDPWDGMFHCWQMFAPVFEPGREAIGVMGAYIREQIFL
ncbi:MAG TPA: alpha/beta hydrolase [Syntrophorhabdaceae bacterium]|nr:alpha/beta hydrolase [Syntrophorhabdaceae bacterium]